MEENTGFMDKLAELVSDFDMEKFMPELDSVIGWVELLSRVAVMIGPVLVLIFGLIYFFIPPKEANHLFGYRLFWGMSSVDAWQYTQKTAGWVWLGLGLGMTVAMSVICNSYRDMAWEAMLLSALISVIVELLFVIVSTFLINALVILQFDRKGVRRGTEE